MRNRTSYVVKKADSVRLTKEQKEKATKQPCLKCDKLIIKNTYKRLCDDCRDYANHQGSFFEVSYIR